MRRFLLVGLFVIGPAKRGSVMQLVLATLVCLVYLMIQLLARPYRAASDDLLAIASSFLLLLFFLACLVLEFPALTGVDELHRRMSMQMQAAASATRSLAAQMRNEQPAAQI